MRPTLITLATAWGPRFGGINTFNTELVKSLGVHQARDFDVVCLLPRITPEDAQAAQASYALTLLGLNRPDDEFDPATLTADVQQILTERGWQAPVWLGHDDKTWPLALQLRDALRWCTTWRMARIRGLKRAAAPAPLKKPSINGNCSARRMCAWRWGHGCNASWKTCC